MSVCCLVVQWPCPICPKNYSWKKIIIDPYFNRITSKMLNSGEDVAEIEVKPDGSWHVKAECNHRGRGELGLWHLPDGTLCEFSEVESKPKPDLESAQLNVGCDNHAALKLGIRKNRNGCWEVSKLLESNVTAMSGSTTGSGIDGEDASVKDGGFNDPFTAAPVANAEVIQKNPNHQCLLGQFTKIRFLFWQHLFCLVRMAVRLVRRVGIDQIDLPHFTPRSFCKTKVISVH